MRGRLDRRRAAPCSRPSPTRPPKPTFAHAIAMTASGGNCSSGRRRRVRHRRDSAVQPASFQEGRHLISSNTSVLAVAVVKTCFILVATLLSYRVASTASAAAAVASVMAFVAAFSVGLGPTTRRRTPRRGGDAGMPLWLRVAR
uniref:Uncharacterized protein n=1 Tax=Leersia perrieri TaxID=77586 RepID=A0A0D9XUJ1_9ORYZ